MVSEKTIVAMAGSVIGQDHAIARQPADLDAEHADETVPLDITITPRELHDRILRATNAATWLLLTGRAEGRTAHR